MSAAPRTATRPSATTTTSPPGTTAAKPPPKTAKASAKPATTPKKPPAGPTTPDHTTTATTPSNDAPRLLRIQCNHWRHKFEITRDDEEGHAFIPFQGEDHGADFFVEDGALRIVLTQPNAEDSERYQTVIENHLNRFARDETLAFDWQPG